MSRELKRVPLEFNWPLEEVWGGYLNPFSSQSVECLSCGGSGSSSEIRRLSDEWYGTAPFDPVAYGAKLLTVAHPVVQAFARRNVEQNPGFYRVDLLGMKGAIRHEAGRLWTMWIGQWSHHLIQADVDALVAAGRLMDFTHVPRTEEQREVVRQKVAAGGNSWLPEPSGYVPTADEVNEWSILAPMGGHDAINRWVCVLARAKREGVAETRCTRCGGEGSLWPSPEVKVKHDAWEEIEPPVGEGYQLWETLSEGSPISPVFPTAESFVDYLVGEGYSKHAAEKFVQCGWAPSGLGRGGDFKANIHALDFDE